MSAPFRLALVTGASSGIGESLCQLLAKQGVSLIITGRNQMALYHLADRLRCYVNVVVYPADLANDSDRQMIVRKIHELSPDLVINNAGFGLYGEAAHLSTKHQLEVLQVNAEALTEITLEGAKALLKSKTEGVIVNISSAAGFLPFPNFSIYAATKAYVNSFSQALDVELAPKGIRVLTACPGMVKTKFSLRASHGEQTANHQKKMSSEYAAETIWKQIQKRKRINIFSGFYKWMIFLTNHVIPTSIVMRVLKRSIKT